MAQPTQAELDSILNTDITYRYQMLSRMKADCEYALKAGSMRHLWAENDPEKQIACMRAIRHPSSSAMWLHWDSMRPTARSRA